jgi:hypothetical protein
MPRSLPYVYVHIIRVTLEFFLHATCYLIICATYFQPTRVRLLPQPRKSQILCFDSIYSMRWCVDQFIGNNLAILSSFSTVVRICCSISMYLATFPNGAPRVQYAVRSGGLKLYLTRRIADFISVPSKHLGITRFWTWCMQQEMVY